MAKKILVIDDEPTIVKVVESRLKANGYEVVCAYDGQEGLQKVASQSPDLIIVDIGMPKVDGYTFVKEVRAKESTSKTPIIVLTARDKMRDLFEMEGVKDYLAKPFKAEELLERVNSYFKD